MATEGVMPHKRLADRGPGARVKVRQAMGGPLSFHSSPDESCTSKHH
jgi:hypothetical protein